MHVCILNVADAAFPELGIPQTFIHWVVTSQ